MHQYKNLPTVKAAILIIRVPMIGFLISVAKKWVQKGVATFGAHMEILVNNQEILQMMSWWDMSLDLLQKNRLA